MIDRLQKSVIVRALTSTVKQEMLVAIIFGGFENITIWLRFNLAISLKGSGWGPYFFPLGTTNFGEIYYFPNNLLFYSNYFVQNRCQIGYMNQISTKLRVDILFIFY